MKPIEQMSKGELEDWKFWAQDEVREYRDFIDEINQELSKRINVKTNSP